MSVARWLSAAQVAEVARHAEAAYPRECCGALLGGEGGVVEVLPLENSAADPRRGYALSAKEYLRAARAAEARGLAFVGVYHSHPDAPAEFSARDAEFADATLVYVVVPVQRGGAGTARAYAAAAGPVVACGAAAFELDPAGDQRRLAPSPPGRRRHHRAWLKRGHG